MKKRETIYRGCLYRLSPKQARPTVDLSVSLSVCLSVPLSCLSGRLPVYLSICLSVCLYGCLSVCLSVGSPACLSVYQLSCFKILKQPGSQFFSKSVGLRLCPNNGLYQRKKRSSTLENGTYVTITASLAFYFATQLVQDTNIL